MRVLLRRWFFPIPVSCIRPFHALSAHPKRIVGFASTASTPSTSGTNRLNSVEAAGYLVEVTGSWVEAETPMGSAGIPT